jgi:hypothetical protein
MNKTLLTFSGLVGSAATFAVALAVLYSFHAKHMQRLPDPSALSPNFQKRPLPILIKPAPIVLPENRPQGHPTILEESIAAIHGVPTLDQLETMIVQASNQVHPDGFANLPTSIIKDYLAAPMASLKLLLSDQCKPADLRVNEPNELVRHFAFLLDPAMCQVGPDLQQMLLTMKWALKCQHMISRLLLDQDEPAEEEEIISLISPLSTALHACASQWEQFALTKDDPATTTVAEWLRAPLTDEIYQVAWRPVPKYLQTHRVDPETTFQVTPRDVWPSELPGQKPSFRLKRFEGIREAVMRFMNPKKLPGPVWYMERLDNFLELCSTSPEDQNYWHQHLLQTLPVEMVGPWAEDFVLAAAENLNDTEALSWLHWASRTGCGRLFNLLKHHVPRASSVHAVVPPSPHTAATLRPLQFLVQFVSPKTFSEWLFVRPLVDEGVCASLRGTKDEVKVEADAHQFALQALASLDGLIKGPSQFAVMYLKYAFFLGENGKAINRSKFIFGLLSKAVFESLGFFKSTASGFDLGGKINPEFMRVVAFVIGKCLQLGIKPANFFSAQLTNLLASLLPPTTRQCLYYSSQVKILVPNEVVSDFELQYKGLDNVPPYMLQSLLFQSCAARPFALGSPSTDGRVHTRRRLLSAEWYIKRCRQVFLDTMHSFMSTLGWTYFDSEWISQLCLPSAALENRTLDQLVSSFYIDVEGCQGATVGGSKLESALGEAIKTIGDYAALLEWLNESPLDLPTGLFKGRFRFTCEPGRDKDIVNDTLNNKVILSFEYSSQKAFEDAIRANMAASKELGLNYVKDTKQALFFANLVQDPDNFRMPDDAG